MNVQLNHRLIIVNIKKIRTWKCRFCFLLAQLKLNEVVSEGFCLRTQPIATPSVQNLLVGEYSLYWKRFVLFFCEFKYHFNSSRTSHPNIPELCTTFSLADFNVELQQVYVEVTIPNHVPLQEPFQINYRIHNRSNIVHEYKVNLEQINLIVAVAGSTVVRRFDLKEEEEKKSSCTSLDFIACSTA